PVRTRRRRHYKIQEVIKRRQIILVQVVKEERGNKGAALTTYISLAGRYTVLMPNTARGGGISRKITNPTDRKRLRKIASDLEVALGMGLIIRTAGASRTKAEIKRDYEYLLRMWENIRDLTLQSTAPTLVYEEGNLIKRSIRDLYGKEIDSVLVSGDEAYKEAKGFMKLLMPSHAKNVQPYKEPEPIFVRHQIERQMAAIFLPHVTLKSGGYIVINQTEALVSVDVNSGKSTREHSIEDTALRTNLEAAEEVARQMRLRDLAGLLVIDFIDMEERRNNRAVERRLKDSLKNDRARIQLGRISHFGLMEMSRQRLRAGVLEGSTAPCTMCQGTGIVRSTESVALDILRTLEDTLLSEGAANLVATTSYEVALYILNQKRSSLKDIETRYRIDVSLAANDKLHGANFNIERGAASTSIRRADSSVVSMDDTYHEPAEEEAGEVTGEGTGEGRRRRGRGGRGEAAVLNASEGEELATREDESSDGAEVKVPDSGEREDAPRRPRRRGRRGGRRTRGSARARAAAAQTADAVTLMDAPAESIETPPPAEMPETSVPAETPVTAVTETEEKPKRKPRRASAKTSTAKTSKAKAKTGEQDDGAKKPATRGRKKAAKKETPAKPAPDSDGNGSADRAGVQEAAPAQAASAAEAPEPKPAATKQAASEAGDGDSNAEPQQRRGGWWQRGA
ncbi:MAG: Rne/Rng family ribonuclease, partial [Alphaproteobacteria bacterium]|nr:Rne/Rng family ribonuclease [Alphaproteobacteria bacterium]